MELARPSARWLLPISALAAVLRLAHLARHDATTDEVFYGLRAIGLVDTLNAPAQPTPFEWLDPVPWWAHLSFHDHPPLGFWVLHGFLRTLGDSLVGLRLAPALAGTASVALTYLVAKRLWRDERPALLAAALLAVNGCHVFFSRIALLEPFVVAAMLLATWLFLKALDDPRWLRAAAAATGAALLVKYTAVVLLPVFAGYAAWRRRELLAPRRLAVSAALFLLVVSPVLVYNAMLLRERGHLDFQLSHLLGQEVAAWQVRPGREVGSLARRAADLLPRLAAAYGPAFTAACAAALAVAVRARRRVDVGFVLAQLACLSALLVAIGPQPWFTALLAPGLALLVAAALTLAARRRRLAAAGAAALLLVEAAWTVQSSVVAEPAGREGWTFSELRRDARAWGFGELDRYVAGKTRGRYPAAGFPARFGFVRDLRNEAVERARAAGASPSRTLFVADSSISRTASLWYLSRRQLYGGWTFVDEATFLGASRGGPGVFARQGFDAVVFVRAAGTLIEPGADGRAAAALEARLAAAGAAPHVLPRPGGGTAFRVYELPLEALPSG